MRPTCAVCVTSAVMYSDVPGLRCHLPLTDSPRQLPVLRAPYMVSTLYGCTIFTCHTIFLLYLFYIQVYLETRLPTIVLELPAVFSTVTYCTGLEPRGHGLPHSASVYAGLSHPGLCKCTLGCLHDDEVT